MDTKIIQLDANKPSLEAIKEIANAIDQGRLVVFPTETVYGIASRVASEPLARLDELKERAPHKHYTLHIGPKLDAYKYVPRMPPIGRQLVKKRLAGAPVHSFRAF